MLGDSYQGDELGVVSDANWGHDLSFELFFGALRVEILLYFFDGDWTSSPFSFEDLWGVAVAYFLLEDESAEVYEVLFCVFFDFLHDELFQIDEVVIVRSRRLFESFLLSWSFGRLQSGKGVKRNERLLFCWRFLFGLFGRLLLFSDVDEIAVFGLIFKHFRRLVLHDLLFFVFVLIEEEVHEFYFIDICFVFWVEHFLRNVAVAGGVGEDVDLGLGLYFSFFFFFEFALDDTEEIFELVVFIDGGVDAHEIFVQILMSELHHVTIFLVCCFFLGVLLESEVLEDFVFLVFGFREGLGVGRGRLEGLLLFGLF